MKSIYDPATLHEFITRIDNLTPATQRQWGTMDVAQMMAHCSVPLEVAVGDTVPKSGLMAKLIGPLVKSVITDEKPFKQGLPTDKSFVITDARDFIKEKTKLTMLLTRLSNASKEDMANRRHPFFGKLTPDEWSNSTVKHMDHHLRQFGV